MSRSSPVPRTPPSPSARVRSKRTPSTRLVAEHLDGRVVEVQVQAAARAGGARGCASRSRVRSMTFSWLLERGGGVEHRRSPRRAATMSTSGTSPSSRSSIGRELDVGGTAAAEHVHVGDGGGLEPGEHVVGDLGRAQVDGVLREHARDVERDVAVADHGDLGRLERPLARHVGVPVEPGDEVGGAVASRADRCRGCRARRPGSRRWRGSRRRSAPAGRRARCRGRPRRCR